MQGNVSLAGLEQASVGEEYERRGLAALSDARLARLAVSILSAPLDSGSPATSFVLHAPLELLARVALLPRVAPEWRRTARVRILSLVSGYEQAGDRLRPRESPNTESGRAAIRLRSAIAQGDLNAVDELAPLIARRISASELAQALAEDVLGHLGAAGHANIYLDLAQATEAGPLGLALLWPMVRELAKTPGRAMASAESPPPVAIKNMGVAEALARLPNIGGSFGIAPMVERAEAEGVIDQVLDHLNAAIASNPESSGQQMLRAAALMMLQGPPDHAPYGWTHCLTLTQAALALGPKLSHPARAAVVGATYVAAHWSSLAKAPFDPRWEPQEGVVGLEDALAAQPSVAAATVWHAPEEEHARIEEDLVTRASVAHDAHHVKYTLACLRAAAADPPARRIFYAAAAYLGAWWPAHSDASDPLVGLGKISPG